MYGLYSSFVHNSNECSNVLRGFSFEILQNVFPFLKIEEIFPIQCSFHKCFEKYIKYLLIQTKQEYEEFCSE